VLVEVRDVAAQEPGERLARREVGARVPREAAQRVGLLAVDGGGQRLAGGEVAVERARADARERGEVVEADGVVALGERGAGGGDDRVAVAARVGAERLRRGPSLGDCVDEVEIISIFS
jgi:hypothetical protein